MLVHYYLHYYTAKEREFINVDRVHLRTDEIDGTLDEVREQALQQAPIPPSPDGKWTGIDPLSPATIFSARDAFSETNGLVIVIDTSGTRLARRIALNKKALANKFYGNLGFECHICVSHIIKLIEMIDPQMHNAVRFISDICLKFSPIGKETRHRER